MLANLAAFLSFERWQKDPRRLRAARRPATDTLGQSELEGEYVFLGGLKARAELNWQRVLVGKYDPTRCRFAVTLGANSPSPRERILVRRANLFEEETRWCREAQISHTSLQATARTVEHVHSTLFHRLPSILCHHHAVRALHPTPSGAAADPRGAARGAATSAGRDELDGRYVPGVIFSQLVDKRGEMLLRKLLQTLRPAQDRHAATSELESGPEGPCYFFRRGCCSVNACPYSHYNAADTRPMCRFALSGQCKFGARCRNRHPVVAASADENEEVTRLQQHVQEGLGSNMRQYVGAEVAGVIDSGPLANCKPPPDFTAFRSVLLLGEGDFTFAAALASAASQSASRGQSARIVATSLQSEAEVRTSHPKRASEALAALASAGGLTLFGLDARFLDECAAVTAQPPDCIVWNLPFAGDIERGKSVKSEPNQQLLRGFFSALIRCVERWHTAGSPPPKIYVTVSVNQFSDWGLLGVAQDCFVSVKSVRAFEPSMYGQYRPRRNEREDTFDAGALRTYELVIDEARIASAAHALREAAARSES